MNQLNMSNLLVTIKSRAVDFGREKKARKSSNTG